MWPLFWFFADEKHRLCLIDRSVARNAGVALTTFTQQRRRRKVSLENYWSRSSRRRILPTVDLGNSACTITCLGTL